MSIRRLQQSVISNLRSGVAINTVVQCVQELVENAIDAESTCIAVRLDLQFLKIQIVDNGRGINKQDFELLGERYATSKCHCLDDLDTDSEHFGYRGEALASICGVSQSVTISSRSKLEKGTWSKIFMEGVVSPQGVQKSVVERPSSGTTVTVVGFLHTLPVRRQSVDMILEMEKVKRSMEYTALSHSNISFSLRNDALDVWCFQAPKTSSAVSTFAHLFGSEWSKLFKPLNDSEGPYTLKGHVAVKGSRNKSMQFLFLKKRRLAHNKLQHLINQIASKSSTGFLRGSPLENGDSPKTPTCQKVFTCVETFPVYILEIDCPKDFYDFRLHPSKTVVEFQEFKIVYELVSRAFSDFFGIGLQNERNFSVNKQLQPIHTTAHSSLHINVHDCVNSLHSLPVKRCYNVSNRESSQIQVENVKKLMGPHFEHSNTTQKSLLSTSLSQSCTTASIRSVRAPTLKNSTLRDRFSLRPDECKDSPIRLPTSLDSSLTPLGRLTHKKEQQQRLKRTLRDLRKFSRRNPSPVASHHNVEKKLHESNAIHHMNGDQQLDRLVEEQFTYPSEVLLENEFVEGQEHNTYQNNCDMTDDESRMISFNEMAIRKTSDELISTFCRRKGDTSVRSPVLLEPKVRMARSLEDSQKHGLKVVQDDQSFIGDQDIEDVNPAKLTAVNKEHPKVKQIYNISDHVRHKNANFQIVASHIKEDSSSPGCSHQRSLWMVGVDQRNQDFYIASESGNSYYGLPPPNNEVDENFGLLISGQQLPMDLVVDDCSDNLATNELPLRPWGIRLEKGSVHNDEVIEDLFYTWKNPVYEADYKQMISANESKTFLNSSLPMTTSGIKSYVFSKDIFTCLDVIAQVDQKFILCSVNGRESKEISLEPLLLILFDQHAVHERIRLEELIKAETMEDNGSWTTVSCPVEPPLILQVPVATVRICVAYKSKLQKRGLEISVNEDSLLEIHKVPRCLMERETSECKMKRPSVLASLVETMIKDLVEVLEETGTFGDIMPKITLDVLKSQACHGAIKFGERLSLSDCQQLINMVAKCKLPFCCAHGRPSVIPLVDLAEVQEITSETSPQHRLKKLSLQMKAAL